MDCTDWSSIVDFVRSLSDRTEQFGMLARKSLHANAVTFSQAYLEQMKGLPCLSLDCEELNVWISGNDFSSFINLLIILAMNIKSFITWFLTQFS